MPEIAGPIEEIGALVLTIAGNAGGVQAKRGDGTLDPLVTWNLAQGDTIIRTAVGTDVGGGARRVYLDAPGGTVVGSADPGGTEMLRVGGTVRIGGASGIVQVRVVGDGTGDRLRLAALSAGSGVQVDAINAAENSLRKLLLNASPVVVGTDPGGTQLLRVGGTGYVAGRLSVEHTTAEDNSASIANQSPTGYGARLFGGAGSRYSLSVEDYLGNVVMRASTLGVVVGADPGGSEKLRVAGGVRTTGAVNIAAGSGAASLQLSGWDVMLWLSDVVRIGGVSASQWVTTQIWGSGVIIANFDAGSTVFYTDPGGSERLRIGGAVRAAGGVYATHATSGDNCASFQNLSATGYGVYLRGGGSAGRYVAAIADYNANNIVVIDAPLSASETCLQIYCVDVAAIRRVYIGPATGVAPAGARVMYVA